MEEIRTIVVAIDKITASFGNSENISDYLYRIDVEGLTDFVGWRKPKRASIRFRETNTALENKVNFSRKVGSNITSFETASKHPSIGRASVRRADEYHDESWFNASIEIESLGVSRLLDTIKSLKANESATNGEVRIEILGIQPEDEPEAESFEVNTSLPIIGFEVSYEVINKA